MVSVSGCSEMLIEEGREPCRGKREERRWTRHLMEFVLQLIDAGEVSRCACWSDCGQCESVCLVWGVIMRAYRLLCALFEGLLDV